jgi:hypothetical protein
MPPSPPLCLPFPSCLLLLWPFPNLLQPHHHLLLAGQPFLLVAGQNHFLLADQQSLPPLPSTTPSSLPFHHGKTESPDLQLASPLQLSLRCWLSLTP